MGNSTEDQDLMIEAIRQNMWTNIEEAELFNISIVVPDHLSDGILFLEFDVSVVIGALGKCSYSDIFNTVVEVLGTNAQQGTLASSVQTLAIQEKNSDLSDSRGNYYVEFSDPTFIRGPTDAPSPSPTCAPVEYGTEISFMFTYVSFYSPVFNCCL